MYRKVQINGEDRLIKKLRVEWMFPGLLILNCFWHFMSICVRTRVKLEVGTNCHLQVPTPCQVAPYKIKNSTLIFTIIV